MAPGGPLGARDAGRGAIDPMSTLPVPRAARLLPRERPDERVSR